MGTWDFEPINGVGRKGNIRLGNDGGFAINVHGS